ncbi:MAG: hypothetical protein FJW14_17095 [Acidimicrobiia bacterium]|nr:hypothetical protein [Acidimicrobiia bacterium]
MESGLVVIEQSGVATWIRESGVLYGYPLVLFLHTLGLSTLAGLSSAIDFRLLGFAPRIPLASLERVFPLMWAGLALTATTGVLLFISDATKHASNPAFWVKLVFVLLAVTTLAVMRTRVFRGQQRGRILAAVSLACWFGALSAGRLMAYIAEFVS